MNISSYIIHHRMSCVACTRIGGPDEGGSSEGRRCWFGWKCGVLCPREALISSTGKWCAVPCMHPQMRSETRAQYETEPQNNAFNQCTRSEHLQGHKPRSRSTMHGRVRHQEIACNASDSVILFLRCYIESLVTTGFGCSFHQHASIFALHNY